MISRRTFLKTAAGQDVPFHEDGEGVVKERIYLDKADSEVLHNDITVEDHALTRPWTVNKRYRRIHDVVWWEDNCTENNHHVVVGKEEYFVGGDYLMPSRKGQEPPDTRYFQTKK